MKALAVAAGIVFWSLVLGIAWFALFSGSDQQEPVAVLQVEPAPEPAPAPQGTPAPKTPGGIDFPPGFSITGPAAPQQVPAVPSVPVPGTTLAPSPDEIGVPDLPETPGDSAEPAPGEPAPGEPLDIPPPAAETPPAAEQTPPAADMAPDLGQPPTEESPPLPDRRGEALGDEPAAATASLSATVPAALAGTSDSDLVEESDYGPQPKIAADGRRPAEIYAYRSSPESPSIRGSVRVAILVNGLGLPGAPAGDILKGLPAPISVAYGTYSRDIKDLVAKTRAAGHEVLLQIPLEPENYPADDPGPHTLLTMLPPSENIKRLHWLMSRYGGYVGVTNHMGAKFKTSRESLTPIFEELKKRGLIYVDSGSVNNSAVDQIAGTLGLDHADIDVQIDAAPSVAKALSELEAKARSQGTAIGVAKAKPETVRQLADWAGKLEAKGIMLVPVSAAALSQRQI